MALRRLQAEELKKMGMNTEDTNDSDDDGGMWEVKPGTRGGGLMPRMEDQADWATMLVHPSARGIKEALVMKHRTYDLDAVVLELLCRLNATNANRFANGYAPRNPMELSTRHKNMKAMSYIKGWILGCHDNTRKPLWRDPQATRDHDVIVGTGDEA